MAKSKNWQRWHLVAAICAFAIPQLGCGPSPEQIGREATAAFESFADALRAKDIKRVEALLADDFVYNVPNWKISRSRYLEIQERLFGQDVDVKDTYRFTVIEAKARPERSALIKCDVTAAATFRPPDGKKWTEYQVAEYNLKWVWKDQWLLQDLTLIKISSNGRDMTKWAGQAIAEFMARPTKGAGSQAKER